MLDISKFERMEDYRGDHTIFYFPRETKFQYLHQRYSKSNSSEFYIRVSITQR